MAIYVIKTQARAQASSKLQRTGWKYTCTGFGLSANVEDFVVDKDGALTKEWRVKACFWMPVAKPEPELFNSETARVRRPDAQSVKEVRTRRRKRVFGWPSLVLCSVTSWTPTECRGSAKIWRSGVPPFLMCKIIVCPLKNDLACPQIKSSVLAVIVR